MVWRTDKNGVNTFRINQITVVGELRSVSASMFGVVLLKMLFIYIGNRHNIGKRFQPSGMRTSDASIANDAHSLAVHSASDVPLNAQRR
jgi:hypothetical protein